MTLDQIGLDAMYNAAFAAELNRDFKKAIDLYTQYGKIEPDRRKQDRALWSIAGIYRQQGDVNGDDRGARPLAREVRQGRRQRGRLREVVLRHREAAGTRRAARRRPRPRSRRRSTRGRSVGAIKNTHGREAAPPSTRSTTPRTFYDKTWAPFADQDGRSRRTDVKQVKTQIEAQKAAIEGPRKKAEDKYIALDQYGVLEASMAAKVRFGDIQYDRAQKIADIPVPKLLEKNPDVRRAVREAARRGAQEGPRRGEAATGPRSSTSRRRAASRTSGASTRSRTSRASSPTSSRRCARS